MILLTQCTHYRDAHNLTCCGQLTTNLGEPLDVFRCQYCQKFVFFAKNENFDITDPSGSKFRFTRYDQEIPINISKE